MVPVEEDAILAFGHIPIQFADITAGVDGVDDSDRLAVFGLELEHDGEFARARREQLLLRELHTETPTPTVEIELLQVVFGVVLTRSATLPTNSHRTDEVDAVSRKVLLRPHLVQFCQEMLHHFLVAEQFVSRVPAQEVPRKCQRGATKAFRPETLFGGTPNDDSGTNAALQDLTNVHFFPPARFLVQVREWHGHHIGTGCSDKDILH